MHLAFVVCVPWRNALHRDQTFQETSMLKKHMAACLVATAFMAAPALAQTPPPSGSTDRPTATGTNSATSGSSAMQPDAAGSSTASPPAAASSTASPPPGGSSATAAPPSPSSSRTAAAGGSPGQFMTQLQGQQMMASKLIGTSVVSANNEAVGDVNDVVVDRNGQAMAVVIGVGGFLGIGEKDVAVPFQALDFNAAPSQVSSGSAPATTGSTGSSQQDSASNRQTATTGNTGNPGRSADAGAASSNTTEDGVPQRIVLKMTKAELQAAPTFRSGGQGSGAASTPARQ
jgi:sporulation protein YlmC with PRC-barrel domain